METYRVRLYSTGEVLPEMTCSNFFHSSELFHMIEKTSGQRPYMAVATDAAGRVMGHLLAIIRRRCTWFPPFLYTQGRIYSEGEYADDETSEEVFGQMLAVLTRKLRRRLCLYIEFSDLSRKMFGYRYLRQNGYFPVSWQEVHNSLHSKPPEERLTDKMRGRIARVRQQGVETREARSAEEAHAFHRLLRNYYRLKLRRIIPPESQVQALYESRHARIFVTTFKGKIIGGCVCVYSAGNAYLWYLASRRKSYPHLHPNLMTVWQAIVWAWKHNYAHIFFLDVGLPFPQNPFRQFILSFGGKPVAKYRWFRFSIEAFNRMASWFYRE